MKLKIEASLKDYRLELKIRKLSRIVKVLDKFIKWFMRNGKNCRNGILFLKSCYLKITRDETSTFVQVINKLIDLGLVQVYTRNKNRTIYVVKCSNIPKILELLNKEKQTKQKILQYLQKTIKQP